MNLAKWIYAMDKFYRVNQIVIPKKQELKVAEERYAEVSKELAQRQKSLKTIQDKVALLEADLNATI